MLRHVLAGLPLAAADSGPELELLAVLRRAALPEPVAQYEVDLAGRRYRVDFAYPDQKVAIEYDGFEPHSGRAQFERDRQRQNTFVLSGWTILRFTRADLADRPRRIVDEVAAALRST